MIGCQGLTSRVDARATGRVRPFPKNRLFGGIAMRTMITASVLILVSLIAAESLFGQGNACPSRIFGGARVLCFVKRIHRSRGAAGIGQAVGLGRGWRMDGRTGSPPAKE